MDWHVQYISSRFFRQAKLSVTLPPPSSRAPGRPKDPGKREAIIAAAKAQFLARGFAGVTMEAVASAANVSKMTVYGHFGDKEALFEAVVQRTTQDVFGHIADLARRDGTLQEALAAFGRSFLRLVCNPAIVAADRSLLSALADNPALARRFYDAGPGQTRALLAGILADADARGEIAAAVPAEAAEDLLSLWSGSLPKCLALGVSDPPDEAGIARQVSRATAVFLRAYAPSR